MKFSPRMLWISHFRDECIQLLLFRNVSRLHNYQLNDSVLVAVIRFLLSHCQILIWNSFPFFTFHMNASPSAYKCLVLFSVTSAFLTHPLLVRVSNFLTGQRQEAWRMQRWQKTEETCITREFDTRMYSVLKYECVLSRDGEPQQGHGMRELHKIAHLFLAWDMISTKQMKEKGMYLIFFVICQPRSCILPRRLSTRWQKTKEQRKWKGMFRFLLPLLQVS